MQQLIDLFERPLQDLCADVRIQSIEDGHAGANALWSEVDALGLGNALIPQDLGGSGLSLYEAGELISLGARCGLPHPLGDTMIARALLCAAGWQPDVACIALAQADPHGPQLSCRLTSGIQLASHVLLQTTDEWLLLCASDARLTPSAWRPHVSGKLTWPENTSPLLRMPIASLRFGALSNAIHAACMAGTMQRVQGMCVQYANDRQQFGRAIGQFQAVQQDLAVLAEQTTMATMAARMAFSNAHMPPDHLLAATGKLCTSDAALRVATIAHAVHGAIGITQEHMLGTFTRRLHEWRMCGETAQVCAADIGEQLLASTLGVSAFMQQHLVAAPVVEV